ncbi:hypothetical protein CYLTODRAFT_348194 [Cylindrobasidium torrendii FP15055 ss-10]|uniref:RAVE complex protein Rav1 C-terminal domain-containing protein n=1 Tax=Cylindrobasidium torrendii FP15055 ss-10 TaxID=1314674 RepID=A0A0D7BKL9_9AGAR|nr:hypothetical protein CYLTODRAFT_348194 [Cylindrobasidium torrendii FP15055 ss-10]
MLTLQNTYAGAPNARLHYLALPNETLLLYPSADAVLILNAATLQLVRALAFWEAFPSLIHTKESISCISVDSNMKLVVAAMGDRIVSWSLSGSKNDIWHIHSTLKLPAHAKVTAMHNQSGLLAIATETSLAVYTLIMDVNLLTWSQKWIVQLRSPPSLIRFAPSLMSISVTWAGNNAVTLFSTTTGRQTQAIPHPLPVSHIIWRDSADNLVFITVTQDSTLRVFMPVLDNPEYLQLHASVDLHSIEQTSKISSIFYLGGQVLTSALSRMTFETDDALTRRLQDVRDEGWELFLRILEDGSATLTAMANIDRKPPTLIKQFTLQHYPPATFPNLPSYLYLLPKPNSSNALLISTAPLLSYEVDLTKFFDARAEGLRQLARGPVRMDDDDAEITAFTRTPEGKGLVISRSNGVQQVWRLGNAGLEFVARTEKQAVVLDEGRSYDLYDPNAQALLHNSEDDRRTQLPKIEAFYTLPSRTGRDFIIAVTATMDIVLVRPGQKARISKLPIEDIVAVLPVDPMAWGLSHHWVAHDVLLSVSREGVLAFWIPEDAEGAASQEEGSDEGVVWTCTGTVKTGKTGIKKARCSSAKKTALVVPVQDGDELTVWDSKESEFASGLEYQFVFSEAINDLDWTSTPDMQSILAVGFKHHVELLCQQRSTYFDPGVGWAICWKIDLSGTVPYPISDSIWLADGRLLIGAGYQMYLYGQDVKSVYGGNTLFDYVARQNGPLPDYHPQMLLQCLLWRKVDVVKEAIVRLAKDVLGDGRQEVRQRQSDAESLPPERYWSDAGERGGHKKRYTQLFNGPLGNGYSDEPAFSRTVVTKLIEALEEVPLQHLTPNEHAHLLVLIQTTLEIDEQRRSLDANGLRFLTSMRSFYILNRRVTSAVASTLTTMPRGTGKRERLRYRDMVWAFFSESQGLLLSSSISACEGKMGWGDARALGLPVWYTSQEGFKSQLENIARTEYLVDRDPTTCSLLYFALGKVKLVHGLWRQASWHKEQAQMLKFLSNDFSEPRWRTAALKNAYALLGKRRFEYGAAFFLLGGALKDAVNICIRQLDDFQAAVAIARVVEGSNEGPILKEILRGHVLPLAFRKGNRWLAAWAFWLLHQRDLSVRVLVTPLQDLVSALDVSVKEIGEPHYDDPSLALLFRQLRSKTLQAAKGTSEISGHVEFKFVLQIARVFCRMGCHVLALDLVRSWSFDAPPPLPKSMEVGAPPTSPTMSRMVPHFATGKMRRQPSMLIDMDVLGNGSSGSVDEQGVSEPVKSGDAKSEEELPPKKAGLGSLMKSAKQDVNVPEFDMGAFGF